MVSASDALCLGLSMERGPGLIDVSSRSVSVLEMRKVVNPTLCYSLNVLPKLEGMFPRHQMKSSWWDFNS